MSLDEYERLKVIGKGSYGEVWLAKHKSDRKQYVLKKMDLRKASKKERLAAEQEAKLLSNLRHPNIVAYKDTFEGGDGYLYIAMGYCEKGDLYSKLKELKGVPLEERQVVEWFVQIAMALQYMHERNILHRDLKTQNIFLTKNKIIKVGDLGIARVLDSSSDMATTLIGTPYYMSPELFSNKPYNFKSDVWALGCCVYEMTTLKHAFNAKDMNALMYRVLRGKLPPMPDMYRKELVDLIKAMLNKSPDKRPSVNRILRDPYIKENIAIFLEGTKNSINRRPDSAKKERLTTGDGNRPRKPKSDPLSLEPLNTSPDGLEPIKEECTPRESIDMAGSSNRSRNNTGKGSEEPGNSGSSEAKFEKNSKKDQGINTEKHEFISQKYPVAAEADEANIKNVDAATGQKLREKRRSNHSKLPESGYVSGNLDSAKGSYNDREQYSQRERDIRCNDNAKYFSSSESSNAANVRRSRSDESIDSKDVPTAKVRTSSKKKAPSSSVNKPPLPEPRSSVSDSISDVEISAVKRSSVSDFRTAVAEPKSLRSEQRRVSKSEPRSSSSELKPPIPLPRSSDPASSPPKCESSPSISKSSASKSRYSNAQITEGDMFLTDEKKSEARHRPLPPRPLSSSVNPEHSRAVTSRSARSVSSGVDSGHSTSTSSSGYSAKEELSDAPDDRILERISRSSQDVPVPRQSIESNARQRRRQQQLQQQANTPRMSKSIDVSVTPLESFRGSFASDAGQREQKSTNYEHYKSSGERNPSREASCDLSSIERERLPSVHPGRNENGNSSEPEEEDNSRRKTQEKEENKEISRFINLLGTTLLMKKTKDSDDEIDGKLEGSIEESCSSPKPVYGRTYLMPAPSPLPLGSKYPYIDESSRPLAKSKNSRQKALQESPVVDRDSEVTDKLDSAISMTSTGRLFERIALLRRDCIHALGVQKLKIAYDILECFDTDELEPKLIDLLGQEAFDAYAGKIWQLKFCEDSAFRLQ